MMDEEGVTGARIDRLFTRTLSRLETLSFCDVQSDGEDNHRFVRWDRPPGHPRAARAT